MQLARKITLPLALSAILALGVSAWLSVREAVTLHHADIERDQGAAGRVLLVALERERAHGTYAEAAVALLAAANHDPQRMVMRLVAAPDLTLHSSQRDALARGEAVFTVDVWRTAETWLPTTLADGSPGALWVQESLTAESEFLRATIASHAVNVATLGVLWAVLAGAFGAVVVGRPMRSLAEKARRVSRGDYLGPLTISQHDEIGELAAEMNKMCDELLASHNRLKREIAEKETVQAALRHADRLTTVGLLAAGIAHELGTPLNVASMRARMIATGEVEGEAVRANAEIIHQQAAQMTRIIRQLLDFARRSTPSLTRVQLPQLVAQSASMLSPLVEKSRCTVTIAAPTSVEVDGDANQLQQVITNLVVNAVQAMPQGGPVRLTVSRGLATPPPDVGGPAAEYARLDVSDEGGGITADVLPHIFEPFFTTKAVGDGNGLGLSVAWGILSDHGGWISAESKPGAGTTFSLFLPLERRPV